MRFKDLPIQKKLMRGIAFISGMVLLVTCVTFYTYEFFKSREISAEKLSTIGEIMANNSTAALSFLNEKDANQLLFSLRSERHIVAACLYDKDGKIFAKYPSGLSISAFPSRPEDKGYRFRDSHLEGFEPVVEESNMVGTLYLKSDLEDIYERFMLYGFITTFVIILSALLIFQLARILRNSISAPILALAETAKIISDKKDYSVRAVKFGNDELGSLTEAFNQMLLEIHKQNQSLQEFNLTLELRVKERTREIENVNVNLKSYAQQLLESEAQIQTIFKGAPDAVIVIDEEGKIVKWNPRAEIIFGYTEAEVIGKYLHETIIPERFREGHQKGMQHFLKTKEGPILDKAVELPALRKDNTEFDAGIRISPTVLKGKYYFIGFVSDISYRKKSEAEIQQKSEALARSNTELEQFAYVASHDLQEPLRMVSSFLQLLEKNLENKLDKDAKEYIDFAVDGARRMKSMIDDLLSYSRIISVKPKFEKLDIDVVLHDVMNNLKESIEENHANIVIGEMPVTAVDRIKITRLFQNLIANAIKFKEQNATPVIEIGSEEQRTHYLFSVRDNGIGIKKEYQDKLFVIFQRLHSKQEYAGTGIGLAECKKIVELHDGKIWVESEPGKGSTFFFTLKKSL